MRVAEAGIDGDRLPEQALGVRAAAFPETAQAQIGPREPVAGVGLDHRAPEAVGVEPVPLPAPRQRGEDGQRRERPGGGAPSRPGRNAPQPLAREPGEAERGKVGVAVGEQVRADLEEAGRRRRQEEIGPPRAGRARRAPANSPGGGRKRCDRERGEEEAGRRGIERARHRIEALQSRGPQRFRGAVSVARARDREAVGDSEGARLPRRADAALERDVEQSVRGREREHRRQPRRGPAAARARGARDGERVERGERERKGHVRALGGEPERVQDESSRRPSVDPREHGPQREGRTEHVAAFRGPRHRLDAQRVQGEQQRRERGGRAPGSRLVGAARLHHPVEQAEGQGRVQRVQEDVGQVVAERAASPKEAIRDPGQPRDRVPDHPVRAEHPAQVGPGRIAQMRIVREEAQVVEVEEARRQRAGEHQGGQGRDGPGPAVGARPRRTRVRHSSSRPRRSARARRRRRSRAESRARPRRAECRTSRPGRTRRRRAGRASTASGAPRRADT